MNTADINRRRFLMGLCATMGATLTPFVAKAAEFSLTKQDSKGPLILTSAHLRILKVISDIIIPTTDTPGATDVGVHHFINRLVSHFLDGQERQVFIEKLDKVKHILNLPYQQQVELVADWDKNRSENPFFGELKHTTIFAYYTSEIGATQELRYDPVPGPYKEIPLADIGRIWV